MLESGNPYVGDGETAAPETGSWKGAGVKGTELRAVWGRSGGRQSAGVSLFILRIRQILVLRLRGAIRCRFQAWTRRVISNLA